MRAYDLKPRIDKIDAFVTLHLAQMDFYRYICLQNIEEVSIYSDGISENYFRMNLLLHHIFVTKERIFYRYDLFARRHRKLPI